MADVSIVRSLWGREAGFDENFDLVIKGKRVTSFGASGHGGSSPIATVVATERGNGITNNTILTCTAMPIAITDEAGVSQWGGTKVYAFPEGGIIFLGGLVSGAMTLGVTGTIINTWAGVASLGTVVASATGAATLVTTAATWLQQFTVSAATSKVATIDGMSAATQLTESGARHVDGTAGAVDMYLNLKVTDDATHTSGTGTFTGTIKFFWLFLGDN